MRIQQLAAEAKKRARRVTEAVSRCPPQLLDIRGVGTDSAAALYRIVITRRRRDTRTRLYLERRTDPSSWRGILNVHKAADRNSSPRPGTGGPSTIRRPGLAETGLAIRAT